MQMMQCKEAFETSVRLRHRTNPNPVNRADSVSAMHDSKARSNCKNISRPAHEQGGVH